MGSTIRWLVRRDTYRDSVELMRVAAELEQLPGVTRAALLMATPANRGLLAEAGLLVGEATAAGPNDLVVAVAASDEASTSIKALEGKVSERFDRLDQNVGAAFSAYSGVLKLAVAALDRTDQGANHVSERTVEFALRGAEKVRR